MRFFIAPLCLMLVVGCKSTDQTAPNPAGVITGGTVDDTLGFAVGVSSDFSNYIVHDASDPTFQKPCVVLQTDSGAELDKTCMIEAPEADLHYDGVAIVANVPSNMCSFLLFSPYYFYSYPSGTGPTNVIYYYDKNGNYGYDAHPTTSGGVIPAANVGQVLTNDAFGNLAIASTVTILGGEPHCIWDFSQTKTNGVTSPNCCAGTYASTVFAWNPNPPTGSAGYIPATQTAQSWGGDPSKCIAGPAIDSQQLGLDNYPKGSYFVADNGVNFTYVVASPNSKQLGTNLYAANYATTPSNIGAFSSPYGATNSQIGTPSPYYEYQCVDSAENLIARIRIQVRSWTTMSEFNKGSGGIPQLEGNQAFPFNQYLNDFRGYWDQFGPNLYPGAGL